MAHRNADAMSSTTKVDYNCALCERYENKYNVAVNWIGHQNRGGRYTG